MKKLLATFAILIALGAVNAMAATDNDSVSVNVTVQQYMAVDMTNESISISLDLNGAALEGSAQLGGLTYWTNVPATITFTAVGNPPDKTYLTVDADPITTSLGKTIITDSVGTASVSVPLVDGTPKLENLKVKASIGVPATTPSGE